VSEENEKVDVPQVQGTGTLTMFCALNGQHAFTYFHVGCATDENRLNAAFNNVPSGGVLWNILPAEIRQANTLRKFKSFYHQQIF
jgi:hypothetical protein